MSLYSSYKLSDFSIFEINVMVTGIAKYAEVTSLSKMESFKLGVYSSGVAENVALVKQRRTGTEHSLEVYRSYVNFMEALNSYNGLVDFMINYLYTYFNELSVDKQYELLQREFVPNLEEHAKIVMK